MYFQKNVHKIELIKAKRNTPDHLYLVGKDIDLISQIENTHIKNKLKNRQKSSCTKLNKREGSIFRNESLIHCLSSRKENISNQSCLPFVRTNQNFYQKKNIFNYFKDRKDIMEPRPDLKPKRIMMRNKAPNERTYDQMIEIRKDVIHSSRSARMIETPLFDFKTALLRKINNSRNKYSQCDISNHDPVWRNYQIKKKNHSFVVKIKQIDVFE